MERRQTKIMLQEKQEINPTNAILAMCEHIFDEKIATKVIPEIQKNQLATMRSKLEFSIDRQGTDDAFDRSMGVLADQLIESTEEFSPDELDSVDEFTVNIKLVPEISITIK